MAKFKVVIPARFASSRLPGKALLEVNGSPIIQYVFNNSLQSGAEQVVIATDDQRIADTAFKFGAEVCLTSDQHKSGTDRIAEVAEKNIWPDDVVIVNVQGDEPMMPPENIRQVAENLISNTQVSMSTLCTPITDEKELSNSNVVKVIYDDKNIAIYFSRDIEILELIVGKPISIYRHLGIYAYRVGFLKEFTAMQASENEKKESLEQLRALDNGKSIHVEICNADSGVGVDTPEDYETLLSTMQCK